MLCLTYLLFFLAVLSQSHCKDCLKRDQCACAFDDGSGVVDLTSLGNSDNTPRFKDVVASPDDNFYSYNPCYGFTEGACTNAAACVSSSDLSEQVQIGNATKVEYSYDESSSHIKATYTGGTQSDTLTTDVILVCDSDACSPAFTAQGQTSQDFQLTLATACACANGCDAKGPTSKRCAKSPGLTVGSILLIVFFGLVVLYLVLGSVYMKFVKKASGSEIIPNSALWKSLPGLIKTGFIFVVAKCRRKSPSYDSI